MATGVLAQWVGAAGVDDFLARHWGRAPHVVPGGAAESVGLADLALGARLAATPGADVLVARAGALHADGPPPTAEAARALHAEGWTLVIRHAERHDTGLGRLAAGVARELGGAVDIHCYCTPAGGRGFGWHYDAEEVFLLQCVGAKAWRLRANTLDPRPTVATLPRDMQFERETSPLWCDATLASGDCLYIPAGWWHRGEAPEASVSLAVGVQPPVALDLLAPLREALAHAPLWRLRLPSAGTAHGLAPEALAAAWRDALGLLGDDLARMLRDEAFVRAALERLTPPPG